MKDLKNILDQILPADPAYLEKAKERTAQLVMPPRALGRLHEIGERLCSMGRTLTPKTGNKAVLVMAGDHGAVAEGISTFPQEVTPVMVKNFLAGGAGINAIAHSVGAGVHVVDMGVAREIDPASMPNAQNLRIAKIALGTANFTKGPAMSREQAAQAVQNGFQTASELFEGGCDILATGDMGIGNTSPSAAIGMCITGAGADDMVGRGTGLDDQGLARKKRVIQRALSINRPNPEDGLDVLAKVGGFEIGGIAGSILAAACYQKPVVVDGFISTAGALIAQALCPLSREYMFAGHSSMEPGHKIMLGHLGLEPIVQLGLRLGEGTGAAMAMAVIDAAVSVFLEVMTFEEAEVRI